MLCIWRFWVRWYNFSKQVIYQVKYSKSLLIVLKLLNIFMDIKHYNWYDYFNRSPNFPSKFNLNQAYIDQYIGLCCSLFSISSLHSRLHSKCQMTISLTQTVLMVSTNQADPSCFYFRISWILMERHWFYFFLPLHLVQGFTSNNII